MADYMKMYTTVFNAVTDAVNILQTAQVATEKMFIDHDPTPLKLLKPEEETSPAPESRFSELFPNWFPKFPKIGFSREDGEGKEGEDGG